MAIKIEKNVPCCQTGDNRGRPSMFPFAGMEVDDYFFAGLGDTAHENVDQLRRTVQSAASRFGRQHGKKFRTLIDREKQGMRVWRIK